MSVIVVFDSGFGSLSIIKAIQKNTNADIIYFADQKNFPYGKKSKSELEKIIRNTVSNLKAKFHPDLIVVGSNTPSLLLYKMLSHDEMVVGVTPPLVEAQQLTQTNSIAILATSSVVKSTELNDFINKNHNGKSRVIKIDSSDLVELVESGKFIYEKNYCVNKIISILEKQFIKHNVDVVTLSSTHLPFLIPLLTKIFPHISFLDPADKVANQIIKHKLFFPSERNTLRIFSSGDIDKFQKHLKKIGIKNITRQISF